MIVEVITLGLWFFLTLLCLEQGHAFELHQLKWFVQLNET